MYKKIGLFVFIGLLSLLMVSCDMIQSLGIFHKVEDEINTLQTELEEIFSILGDAVDTVGEGLSDAEILTNFQEALSAFDETYGSAVSDIYNQMVEEMEGYLPTDLEDMDIPEDILKDGDIFLAGGVNSKNTSIIINFVNPSSSEGAYSHGAVFDAEKYSGDSEELCFMSATTGGAGYETMSEWRVRPNVAIMRLQDALDAPTLNDAQAAIDVYCSDPESTSYGFFEDAVDVTSPVEKDDNDYFYCTKVVWRVYDEAGIDLDSDSQEINWKNSGLYFLLEAYYRVLYWDTAVANQKIDEYLYGSDGTGGIRKTLVLAEEIYYSDLVETVFEEIRVSY
jgi:hypothetical protein